jgi:hypothetical protein
MPRLAHLSGVALAVLATGCSRPPAPAASKFILGGGYDRHFDAAAEKSGAKTGGWGGVGDINAAAGKSSWVGHADFCAKPEQADEYMRVLRAEVTKRLREDGAEPAGEPPVGQGEVAEWVIAYTSGPLEGTVVATRGEPGVGPCDGAGVFIYRVNFRVSESRKK